MVSERVGESVEDAEWTDARRESEWVTRMSPKKLYDGHYLNQNSNDRDRQGIWVDN
jgi:hypothetical protein